MQSAAFAWFFHRGVFEGLVDRFNCSVGSWPFALIPQSGSGSLTAVDSIRSDDIRDIVQGKSDTAGLHPIVCAHYIQRHDRLFPYGIFHVDEIDNIFIPVDRLEVS